MYRIGVVGEKDSILTFKALGVDVFPVFDKEDTRKIVDKLAATGYAVIFITEQAAVDIMDTIERYKRAMLPAVILIPGNQGSLNIGLQSIRDNIEKAVGVNILDK